MPKTKRNNCISSHDLTICECGNIFDDRRRPGLVRHVWRQWCALPLSLSRCNTLDMFVSKSVIIFISCARARRSWNFTILRFHLGSQCSFLVSRIGRSFLGGAATARTSKNKKKTIYIVFSTAAMATTSFTPKPEQQQNSMSFNLSNTMKIHRAVD